MATNNELTKAYADYFKGWQVKTMGPKPTGADLAVSAALGARVPSNVGLALAMYHRQGGATSNQVTAATGNGPKAGGPQLNKLRGLIAGGKVQAVPTPDNKAGHKVYRMALKGQRKATSAPKAKAKAKAPRKATKASKAN